MNIKLQVGYYLDESRNWALDVQELERSIKEAKTRQARSRFHQKLESSHQVQSQGYRYHQPWKSNGSGNLAYSMDLLLL